MTAERVAGLQSFREYVFTSRRHVKACKVRFDHRKAFRSIAQACCDHHKVCRRHRKVRFEGRKACRESVMTIAKLVEIKVRFSHWEA